MSPLGRFLQLTLYGLCLTADEKFRLYAEPFPMDWKEIAERLGPARVFLKDFRTCLERWKQLDRWSRKFQIQWTFIGDNNYPERLHLLSDPPPLFSFRGAAAWDATECLSVVGSRDPSRDSLEWMRRHLLEFLQHHNVCIASGGARGIDRWAHEIAMLAGRPTVCFLPSGLLDPYPANHVRLFEQIVDSGGTVVSGFRPDAGMEKSYFHVRNRWIAGISSVTLIVEAQRKSGTFLTARMALEEGRSLCALPVSPLSPRGLGNLDLIFDGAYMVRNGDDLRSFFAAESKCNQRQFSSSI